MQRKFTFNRLAVRAVIVGLLLVLAACGGGDDAETEIRDMLAEAGAAASGKDVRTLRGMIAAEYADDEGRDRDAVVNLLRAAVLGRQRLYLHTRIREVHITAGSHARVRLVVAAAGQPIESRELLDAVRPEIARMELDLVRSARQWRVVSARWERGGLGDLL